MTDNSDKDGKIIVTNLEDELKEARRGDVSAQYRVARRFHSSYVFHYKADDPLEEAVFWYKRAAERVLPEPHGEQELRDHIASQDALAVFYFEGDGVEQDLEKSTYWYRMAAELDDYGGQYHLANAYFYGWGIGIDYDRALHWWIKSIEQCDHSQPVQDRRLLQAVTQLSQWHKEALEHQLTLVLSHIEILQKRYQLSESEQDELRDQGIKAAEKAIHEYLLEAEETEKIVRDGNES